MYPGCGRLGSCWMWQTWQLLDVADLAAAPDQFFLTGVHGLFVIYQFQEVNDFECDF